MSLSKPHFAQCNFKPCVCCKFPWLRTPGAALPPGVGVAAPAGLPAVRPLVQCQGPAGLPPQQPPRQTPGEGGPAPESGSFSTVELEDSSEEFLRPALSRQKEPAWASKDPTLVRYGKKAPLRTVKGSLCHEEPARMPGLVLYDCWRQQYLDQ